MWPKQSECDEFYGNPRNKRDPSAASDAWETANIVRIKPPFLITYDGKPYKSGIRIHKKCADSLMRIFEDIWDYADQQQSVVDKWGASIYGGAYNYRLMRGSSRLSMHSWGCAIDLDPDRNSFHDTTPNFANAPFVIRAFEEAGWVWGGRWSGRSCDGMHFQAAIV